MTDTINTSSHKAGFVTIVGKPNAGKSTLMNALVGEKLSIVTSKAQTTRHRILGIVNTEDYQIIYSDTPGIIKPFYQLQEYMMSYVSMSLEDADIVMLVVDLRDPYTEDETINRLKNTDSTLLVVLNKIDLVTTEELEQHRTFWQELLEPDKILTVSAINNINVDQVFESILEVLPVHPPFYEKDALTDRPERFFAAEVVREKIFKNYKKEVPYSTEVVITSFKEEETIIRMRAEIYVERQSQKGILIGKNGEALKKVGIQAREDLEKFFDKQVYLEQFVKVEEDWRKREGVLRKFGYKTD